MLLAGPERNQPSFASESALVGMIPQRLRTAPGATVGAGVSTQSRFATNGPGLAGLVTLLTDLGVSLVSMEATGISWRPVFDALEDAGINTVLANAAHIKNVPGRKTDTADAAWICQLASTACCGPVSFLSRDPGAVRAVPVSQVVDQKRGRVIHGWRRSARTLRSS